MAFDATTRKRLSDFVADARRVLTEEFAEQLQSLYGISVTGDIAPLERLTHLDAEGLELAATLRQRIAYLTSASPEARDATKAAVDRLTREQAFTVLNRLAAIRMAEKRGLIVESVGQQYQSKGFKVFESVAGSAIGETYDRYRCYLFCLFDELAIDLGALFDRRSPQALLFPREKSLLALLGLLDEADLQDLWAEDETIGWIYQYYNDPAERKKMREESAAPRNSRELAVRNQFFTPRYVVEFLTDNTLGRIWYEMTQGATALKEQCRYLVRRPTEIFLKPGESAPEQPKQDGLSQEDLLKQPIFIPHRPLKDPRSILMLDPACGSMHFGLYAFDLLETIYDEAWEIATGSDAAAKCGEAFAPFSAFAASFADKAAFQREVPRMIVEHNLHGIDIDPRAAQIAGLSLWLRAQRDWHDASVKPVDRPPITRSNIVCAEPMPGDKVLLAEFVEQQFPEGERAAFRFLLETVFDRMTLAGEAGSLLKIEEEIRTAIAEAKKLWEKEPQQTQRMLFGGGEDKPGDTQKTLDLSGITDEQFWAGAEDRIYAALSDYAEQAESGGFQRRLFAEDAARGFSFIDVCRKRYDVVLMNPPFGQFSKRWREDAVVAYPNSYNDILGAFVDSFLQRLRMGGRLGAITSRTCFFLTSFKDWREKVVLTDAALNAVADLGQGVMDNAMVEAAAYVMERKVPETVIPFFRAIAEYDKQAVIDACVAAHNEGTNERHLLLARQNTFKKLPESPFVYWVQPEDLDTLAQRQQFEPEVGEVRVGLQTGDDPRFCRTVWEVAPQDTQFVYFPANGESFCRLDDPIVLAYYRRRNAGTPIWAFHVKAGASQPWYSPITLKLNYAHEGSELRNFRGSDNKMKSALRSTHVYYQPGFSWTVRAVRLFPYIVPGNCIPSVSRYMAFPKQGREFEALGVCCGRIASSFMRFYGEKFEWPKFLVETLKMLPWPTLDADSHVFFRELAVSEVRKRRRAYQNHEPFHEFLLPAKISDFSASGEGLSFDATSLLGESGEALVARAYGLDADAAYRVERDLVEAISFRQSGCPSDTDEERDDGDSDFVLDFTDKAQTGALVSYLAGVAFGRWDIRYATGEQTAPDLADPFAPLPVCPPGQLQNAQGLPAGPEDVPATYPLENIPWDGILVDDPNHPLDIERRVREVIEIIWNGKGGGPTAEAIELEACEIVGVKSLRDYFRKPGNFFADHLKRYSKSRRQAPIYWPLSTKSGSYTLWIYYHRLNDQTLHKCIADFLDPKIKDVENDLGKLAGKDSGRAADLRDFLNELKDLKDEIERVIKLPWKPNLNDGVLITASPLWKLFRLSKWQKDLKACWEELEKGDYDWAHLAYTIWPGRVEKVCEKDRSIAIAHGLEHLCKVEPPKPKKPRGKKASS